MTKQEILNMTKQEILNIVREHMADCSGISQRDLDDHSERIAFRLDRALSKTTQLPPLTDLMYHAVRGLEFEFTAGGPYSVIGYFDDDMLDSIWSAINTALRVTPNP